MVSSLRIAVAKSRTMFFNGEVLLTVVTISSSWSAYTTASYSLSKSNTVFLFFPFALARTPFDGIGRWYLIKSANVNGAGPVGGTLIRSILFNLIFFQLV